MKEKAEQKLEAIRSEVRLHAALTIQRHVRGYLQRRRLQMQHLAAVRIQSMYRAYRVFQQYHQLRNAVQLAQSIWRMKLQRRRYLQVRALFNSFLFFSIFSLSFSVIAFRCGQC